MSTGLLILMLSIFTTGFNAVHKMKKSPPYWRNDYFIEKDLPETLKGKPMHYIDSVFKANRK